MRALAWWLMAACALAGGAARASDPGAAASASAVQEDLYLSAMQALAEDRPEDAATLLTGFLEKEPRHAGAWLDLAISQCELGHAAEAERLFREIEVRFAPPPGILEVIRSHRERGCLRTTPRRTVLSVALGRGYDSNVNQGASSNIFSTGSGATRIDWELAPAFLPMPDGYTILSADYTQALGSNGARAFAQLRMRQHDSVHQQDTAGLLAGLEQPWRLGAWRGRATAAYGGVRLDRQLYQRQSLLQLRVTPPLALPEPLEWSLASGINHVSYPSRSGYDSNTVDLSSTLGYHGANFDTQLTLGTLSDNGQSARPGGNRTGRYGGVLLQGRLGPGLSGEAGWTHQSWRSTSVYSPGLIDQVRSQENDQLHAALTYQVRAHHSVQLEWRTVRNRENISLFQYNSHVFQLSWRWDNF